MIRRLTAQHPERNGREAETWGHPSKLASPARLHSRMKRSKGQLWVGEVWTNIEGDLLFFVCLILLSEFCTMYMIYYLEIKYKLLRGQRVWKKDWKS